MRLDLGIDGGGPTRTPRVGGTGGGRRGGLSDT